MRLRCQDCNTPVSQLPNKEDLLVLEKAGYCHTCLKNKLRDKKEDIDKILALMLLLNEIDSKYYGK